MKPCGVADDEEVYPSKICLLDEACMSFAPWQGAATIARTFSDLAGSTARRRNAVVAWFSVLCAGKPIRDGYRLALAPALRFVVQRAVKLGQAPAYGCCGSATVSVGPRSCAASPQAVSGRRFPAVEEIVQAIIVMTTIGLRIRLPTYYPSVLAAGWLSL